MNTMISNEKKDIRAIAFDMDGLMFDTESVCLRAHIEAGTQLNIANPDKLYFSSLAMTYDNMKIFYSGILENPKLAEQFVDLISEISMNIYKNEKLRIKPGLFELLTFLSENHYPIAIASSAPDYEIEHHLNETGISEYFSKIVSGANLEHGKPAPDIYLLTSQVLSITPENMLVLEDSIFGIESAYAANAIPVMIPDLVNPNESAMSKAYAILNNLTEVIPLLKKNR